MSEEENKVGAVTEEVKSPKHFKVGDLTLKCGKCGNIEILQEKIPGGISFILATVEDAEVKMKCGKCDNEINLVFTNMSEERDAEFEKEQEALKVEQELKQKQMEAEKREGKEAEIETVKAEEITPKEDAELVEKGKDFNKFVEDSVLEVGVDGEVEAEDLHKGHQGAVPADASSETPVAEPVTEDSVEVADEVPAEAKG